MTNTLVIGMGEVGKPLYDILSMVYDVDGIDKNEVAQQEEYDWVHICYPYSESFVKITDGYIEQYRPKHTFIHSTVLPGTTFKILNAATHIIYSPVRGRHRCMHRDMLHYPKYVASYSICLNEAVGYLIAANFIAIPVKSVPALEAAKLVETTYSASLIAWSQELQRIADTLGVDREDLLELTKDVPYLPQYIFEPGRIGGHCLIPNIELLQQVHDGVLLDAILKSNEQVPEDGIRRRARPL